MGVHDGHRERLRNRFLSFGLDSLEDHEVLELLLFFCIHRKDTNALAHELLNTFGSLDAVMDASLSELTTIKGISDHTAHLLLLCKPLCRRYMIRQNNDKRALITTELYSKYIMPYFFGAKVEQVYLLCLDAKAKPLCCRELSEGGTLSSSLSIRKAAQIALDCKAVSVILAHNHPGGGTSPSENDRHATTILKETLAPLGIQLIDHIIVSGNNFSSVMGGGFNY